MNFDGYQIEATKYAVYKHSHYPLLALGEEVGELLALFSKQLRKEGDLISLSKVKLASELGDVLWNLSEIASTFGLSLQDIAQYNLDKLEQRKDEGTLDKITR